MVFWIYMLVIALLVPSAMIGFGWLFMRRTPKTIQSLFGYRTAMSMKNKDTWEFAHQYCGKLWFRWGLAMLAPSVVPLLFVLHQEAAVVGTTGSIVVAIQLIPLIGSIFPTERALKKTFDENGIRR